MGLPGARYLFLFMFCGWRHSFMLIPAFFLYSCSNCSLIRPDLSASEMSLSEWLSLSLRGTLSATRADSGTVSGSSTSSPKRHTKHHIVKMKRGEYSPLGLMVSRSSPPRAPLAARINATTWSWAIGVTSRPLIRIT